MFFFKQRTLCFLIPFVLSPLSESTEAATIGTDQDYFIDNPQQYSRPERSPLTGDIPKVIVTAKNSEASCTGNIISTDKVFLSHCSSLNNTPGYDLSLSIPCKNSSITAPATNRWTNTDDGQESLIISFTTGSLSELCWINSQTDLETASLVPSYTDDEDYDDYSGPYSSGSGFEPIQSSGLSPHKVSFINRHRDSKCTDVTKVCVPHQPFSHNTQPFSNGRACWNQLDDTLGLFDTEQQLCETEQGSGPFDRVFERFSSAPDIYLALGTDPMPPQYRWLSADSSDLDWQQAQPLLLPESQAPSPITFCQSSTRDGNIRYGLTTLSQSGVIRREDLEQACLIEDEADIPDQRDDKAILVYMPLSSTTTDSHQPTPLPPTLATTHFETPASPDSSTVSYGQHENHNKNANDGLSYGEIAGITIGAVATALSLVTIIYKRKAIGGLAFQAVGSLASIYTRFRGYKNLGSNTLTGDNSEWSTEMQTANKGANEDSTLFD